ncbi:proteasome adapter and scaffold protein ECM29 isoform X3 [Impatiens glandulifera]|uniref:proteasome adapter and scaffold protein ECM29 isoform X3 n=1 Tax=Impatiens glandulifera TaxID=253017 RepID=UPI001FB1939C|nr:proteasome adapter and scaffold protein ECM29 isoform X3 [Impatiens glandulifera]
MSEPPSSSSSPAAAGKSEVDMEEMMDRMLTRLALCDDSKLENLLSKLIPFSISSLSSPSDAVRKKVMEILSHVNKRVKHQPEICLPVLELWELYMLPDSTPMVKNFCIVYIEMSFDRQHPEKKEHMAPTLISNISKLPPQHQGIILRLAIKVIGDCHSVKLSDEVGEKYKAIGSSSDSEIFLEFCLHTMLYQTPPQGACPAGLSITQSDLITGKQPLKSDVLLIRKLGILNVIEAMTFAPEAVYPLFFAACVDSQEPVVKRGEVLLKKKTSGVDLDDVKLISKLFLLFNGNVEAQRIAPECRVTPGNPTLRVRLMSVFCRSITAANSFPSTLQCIFGCIYGNGTTMRLKQLGMEFTVWVFKHASTDQLKVMGPIILNGIWKSLEGNSASESDAMSRDIKSFAYQAIGLLSQRMPQLFRDKVDMAVKLFDALHSEPQFLRPVIQEATVSLAAAYKGAPATVLTDLEALLLRSSQAEESEIRFCAVRWATGLFDFQHCPSRFICMLGAAESKLDIREMALEGLFPGQNQDRAVGNQVDIKYPKVGDMLEFLSKQQPALLESSETGAPRLLFPSKMYTAMVSFLVKCFEEDVQKHLLEDKLAELWPSTEKLCLIVENAMGYEGSVELHSNAAKALISVGSYFPEIAQRYSLKLSWLKQLLGHLDLETREAVARLVGIASHALPVDSLSDLMSELISSVDSTHNLRFELRHGVICSLGYVTAACMTRTTTQIPESVLQKTLKFLVDIVNTETATLASIAMEALGHIGLRAALPSLHDYNSEAVLVLVHDKLKKLLSGDDMKAIQKVVISLGHMFVKDPSSSHLTIVLDLVFSLCRSKVEDVLFAGGEALSFLWGGVSVTADVILKTNYVSLSMSSNFLMDDVPMSISTNSSADPEAEDNSHSAVRTAVTQKLFNELLYSTKKEERCSGTVWLLSLTMYCGHHPSIQQLLPQIQEAFTHLLGEQHELTQELASQGLSIVYDLGDGSTKQNLVNALVGTLTGSGKRKRAIKLVEDSEVFAEGTLGESKSGGKLGTYKELCNLANEMGQPDLIYKFMDLANYQSSQNSKRAAAFGFSKIAKQAGDALQPHLRLLIPRLVRYQYDPDKNVQDAMSHIWKSLVADSKKTIDEHLDLIIDDLLLQCGSRLWRSREASCLALADIIQGRRFDQVGKYLKRIWVAAFRAMDDIKETVRNSGDRLCRTVASLTTRLCDVSLTQIGDARHAMEIVLPMLLSEGIMSKVDSIRSASIKLVTKLAKGAGVALRPHLSDLVCCMLESLSSLEDQGLNYVELHAATVGIQTEKLENLRISIAKGSPMWETLDNCIDVVDTTSLELLVPRLAKLVQSGVGLNTRVGTANFIGLLVQKVGVDIKPFTGMLLKLLFPAVKEERSASSKRAFANACGLVLKQASPSQAQKLIEDTAALHAGDGNTQASCAILLKSYASMAADIISGYHTIIVPIIYISRFDDEKHVKTLFEELWDETTGTERVTLQLYLGEIVSLICEGLMSSSWGGKKKSALAISKLSEVLGESLSSYHDVLLKCLMKEIPGRLWEGKEALLDALASLCSSCHEAITTNDSTLPSTILNLVISACTKKVQKYREAAFSSMEQIIKAFNNPDFFNTAFPVLYGMCTSNITLKSGRKPLASDTAKEDETEDNSAPQGKLVDCISACIHVGLVDDILVHNQNLLNVILNSLSLGFPWTVKMSVFSLIREICSKLHKVAGEPEEGIHQPASAPSLVNELFHSASVKVIECICTVKIAQVHIAASECLMIMAELYKAYPGVQQLSEELVGLKGELYRVMEAEKNEQAKTFLRKSINILEG